MLIQHLLEAHSCACRNPYSHDRALTHTEGCVLSKRTRDRFRLIAQRRSSRGTLEFGLPEFHNPDAGIYVVKENQAIRRLPAPSERQIRAISRRVPRPERRNLAALLVQIATHLTRN